MKHIRPATRPNGIPAKAQLDEATDGTSNTLFLGELAEADPKAKG